MAGESSEQNKTEEATPFKLRRAREKGMVARGTDLGYLGGLLALALFLLAAGASVVRELSILMRRSLGSGIAIAGDPGEAAGLAGALYWSAIQPILLLGGTVLAVVLFLEVLQLRGFVFSAHPLKPDFTRINPAKGLKRLLSKRMLKESAKSILKMACYTVIAFLVVRGAVAEPGRAATDAMGVAAALETAGMRLLFLFILVALFFAVYDQVLVRREYSKQMRMSRSELTREHKEREGEPRLKQKRKQLHAEFAKQAKELGTLKGSDLLIVNPQHVAVALAYDPARMSAPTVTAKARNHYALAMKQNAFRLGIPIFEAPPLARALYAESDTGKEIGSAQFHAVAELYLKLRDARSAKGAQEGEGTPDAS